VDCFLHKFLQVLQMACHLLLEVMLCVSHADLICHLTSDLVDDGWNSANSSMLAFASPLSGISAVAISYLEVGPIRDSK
jgi:hypothetical protein